jgi:hypothetical protein
MFEFLRYILLGRYQFSNKALFFLKTYGNARILSIKLARHPLPDSLRTIANHLSQKDHFDKLFHIYAIINTDLGEILVEKNERIHITNHISYYRDSEYFTIPCEDIGELTFGEMFENTQKYMGTRAFFGYDVALNNCQHFIVSMLSANDIKSGNSWCLQSVSSIFANHRECKKIINEIIGYKTILDREVDVITENPLKQVRFMRQ